MLEMSALETIYNDQFTLSTQVIKKNCLVITNNDTMTNIGVVVL